MYFVMREVKMNECELNCMFLIIVFLLKRKLLYFLKLIMSMMSRYELLFLQIYDVLLVTMYLVPVRDGQSFQRRG